MAKRYGITQSSLFFHKQNHLTPALIALRKERATALNAKSAKTTVDQLDDMLDRNDRALKVVIEKTHNLVQLVALHNDRRKTLELRAKLTGELDERPQVTVNLQQSNEWIQVKAVILEVLAPYPGAGEELAARLAMIEGGAA